MARLGFRQTLQQTQRQEMQLLPQMLQSIELLQVPRGDLEAFLREAAEENEALRVEDVLPPAPARPDRRVGTAESTDRHHAWLESQAAPEQGLAAHLEEQLSLLDLPPALDPWVRLVIACLDPRGYLTLADEALMGLARERGLAGEEGALGRAIAVVQGLDPRGVGGRDAVEALLLQLDPFESDYQLLCRLLEEFLEEIAQNRFAPVARALGIDLEDLGVLLDRLRELELAPGAQLSGSSSPPIHPDVIVERQGERFEVRVDQSGLPAVTIDPEVQRLARDARQPADVRRYLRGKLERARWLVEGLEQRRRTLLRVAAHVFQVQRGFLEHGAEHRVPLRMGEVADGLGVHLSTVSRAVSGKYADTPWGILPLRSFFPAAAGGKQGALAGDVQRALREVVAAEDSEKPLSDDEIGALLTTRGFRLARRTVAKYRRELGIPSSYHRRQ